ncbi:MAG TPA: DUF2786 domain-containing protein [Anaerovoracaceae bacterium]|nr:DUF2786 domain-containing protein [Anaerovoracaceae bacterium]
MSDPRERIKQLLALARSSASSYEARNARKTAGILMKRHKLNRKEVYQPTPPPPARVVSSVDFLAATLKEINRREAITQAHRKRVFKTIFFLLGFYLLAIGIVMFFRYHHG